MLGLGHLQPVAGKHDRRFHFGGRFDAHREGRFVTEDDGFDLSSLVHDRQARLWLDDAARSKANRLEIAVVGAAGFQFGALEFGRDVLGRFAVLRASGVSPLHRIVGEEGDVGPPAFGWCPSRHGCDQDRERDDQERACHAGPLVKA